MKILSADKARKRTNKYCLLNEKRKKKKLRSDIKEERKYIKHRIKLACENEGNMIFDIRIKHKENRDYLQKLNYVVTVNNEIYSYYKISW